MNSPPTSLGTVAFIFARGGSKGVPGKNLRLLHGKPLIAYSIDLALACTGIDRVIVSTDDSKIAEIAISNGAEVPFLRPAELATDSSPEWRSWQHAVAWVEQELGVFDRFVSLPATAPLRSVADVENCLAALDDDSEVDIVVTGKVAQHSPYFNMVTLNDRGLASLMMQLPHKVSRRQDAPIAFDLTTVAYVTRPRYIKTANGVLDGNVHMVEVPEERALDIDTPVDFMLAEAIMSERLERKG